MKIKIIIDKQNLEMLIMLKCPKETIADYIFTGKYKKTGNEIIDSVLDKLLEIKTYENWGGKRDGAGKRG